MQNVDAKAFLDEESGDIYEIYTIYDGENVVFNLDGVPFKFDNLILITCRNDETIKAVIIHIPKLSQEGLLKIGTFLELPLDKYEIEEMGEELVVRLEMKEEAINKFINPKFPMVRNLKQFFMIRDDVGGSVVLDFYYYTLPLIEPVPPPVLEESEDLQNV